VPENLFGETSSKSDYCEIYHDESESRPNKGWLLIGLMFIFKRDVNTVRAILSYYRNLENYHGEVHFCQLPKSFNGEFGGKARVAKRWIQAYSTGMFNQANVTVLAVDRRSPKFDHKLFRYGFHAYNRFTAMAIKSGIAWHIVPFGLDEIELTLITDDKSRRSSPDDHMDDNFEQYIPMRAEFDSFLSRHTDQKHYPSVTMKNVTPKCSSDDDLLQFIDVILGSVKQALAGGSGRDSKVTLGNIVGRWCMDIQKKPWEQTLKMHRKFNLWAFPDVDGHPYSNLRMEGYQDDVGGWIFSH
jgi:hypothetical protein